MIIVRRVYNDYTSVKYLNSGLFNPMSCPNSLVAGTTIKTYCSAILQTNTISSRPAPCLLKLASFLTHKCSVDQPCASIIALGNLTPLHTGT